MKAALGFSCICFLYCVTKANAAIALLPEDHFNEKHPGHCYTNFYNLGEFAMLEEKKVANQCAKAVCNPDRIILIKTCAVVKVEPPCNIVEDTTLVYPLCCPRIQCPPDTTELFARSRFNRFYRNGLYIYK